MFLMQKKVKNLYLRKGEHSFVLQSQFIFKAKQQKWTSEDIQKIIEKTLYQDKYRVYAILREYSSQNYG
ncbi:hypothetical protein HMPREF0013_03487 [Acinetobacter sp. SH024]|nr:hypothetical protein HMPREF0013_03487 [Acinetobacter sp. SH024]